MGCAGITSKSNPVGSALNVMKALMKHKTASLGAMPGARDTSRVRDRDLLRCLLAVLEEEEEPEGGQWRKGGNSWVTGYNSGWG